MIQHTAAARHPDQLARRECGVVQLQGPVVVDKLPVLGVEPISSRWQIGVLTVPQPNPWPSQGWANPPLVIDVHVIVHINILTPLRVPLLVERTVVVVPHSHKLSQSAPLILGCLRGGAEHDIVCNKRGTVRILEMICACENRFKMKRKKIYN